MEQKNTEGNHNTTGSEKKIAIINFDSWSLSLYKKQKRLVIETLDYHAGPLVITKDQLCDIAKQMGLYVRKRRRKNKSINIE